MNTEERQAMVAAMMRLKRTEAELAEAEANANAVLQEVQAGIALDLEGVRQRRADARQQLEDLVKHVNGGEKFKAPGLGTAYLTRRRSVKITDEAAFLSSYFEDFGSTEDLFDQRLNLTRAKQAAEDILEAGGEIVPGVEVSHSETLTFRA